MAGFPAPRPPLILAPVSLARFIALWTHPDWPPDPVSEAALRSAEARLGVSFPADYRDAVLRCGLPRPTLDLLDAIVDRDLDLRSVGTFLTPAEAVEVTESWREMGLPDTLVAFASDGMGGLYCFPASAGAAPVLFFDHDSGAVEVDSPSFARWIERYCELAPA